MTLRAAESQSSACQSLSSRYESTLRLTDRCVPRAGTGVALLIFRDFTRIRCRERLCTIRFLGAQFSTCRGGAHDKFQTGGDRGLGPHGRRGRQPGAGRSVRLSVRPDVQQLSRLQQLSGVELPFGTVFVGTMSIRAMFIGAVSFWPVRLRVWGAVKLNEPDLLVLGLCAV